MKVLFLSTPPPNESTLLLDNHPSAADLACRGIAEGLFKQLGMDFTAVGFQITKVFPRQKKLIIWPHCCKYANGLRVWMMPAINIALVREFCEGVMSFLAVVWWSTLNIGHKRVVSAYNLSHPPFEFALLACKLTHSKYVPILHDMGQVLYGGGGLIRRTYFKMAERRIVRLLPKVDGAAVITDAIREKYFPEMKTLLLDGGITDEIVARLFSLERSPQEMGNPVVTFLSAGGMTDYNGVQLILDAMVLNQNPNIRVQFAGRGDKVPEILAYVKRDSRIEYLGVLSHDELFERYRTADVLLNIRITGQIDTSLYFPSKFLEALVVGRMTLSTRTGHLARDYGQCCELLGDETAVGLSAAFDRISVMSRAERDRKGKSARQFMLDGHTWDIQAGRLLGYMRGIN